MFILMHYILIEYVKFNIMYILIYCINICYVMEII